LLPQLLEEDLGRVPDLRRPGAQIRGMLRQQRVGRGRPLIGPPRRIPQTPPDGLAIEVKPPRQLRDRHPLLLPQPAHLLPALLTDHRHLLGQGDLWSDGPYSSLAFGRHLTPSSGKEGGENSMTTGGDYWVTADKVSLMEAGRSLHRGRGDRARDWRTARAPEILPPLRRAGDNQVGLGAAEGAPAPGRRLR
jgi:hypothetical protein